MVRHKSGAGAERGSITTLASLCALAAAAAFALPARAGCVLPPPPSKIPDGSVANTQEMLTAMQTLKEYNGDVTVYLKCLEFEAKQNRLSASIRDMRHDAAIEQLQEIADRFNEQVRVFKSKHG
ncbi:MAG TPA: hypothetical protein VMD49_02620 [Steroidobacteraceae bacterium]|nr:hypothetical protein [Steroidobacteraceae bacterium]